MIVDIDGSTLIVAIDGDAGVDGSCARHLLHEAESLFDSGNCVGRDRHRLDWGAAAHNSTSSARETVSENGNTLRIQYGSESMHTVEFETTI